MYVLICVLSCLMNLAVCQLHYETYIQAATENTLVCSMVNTVWRCCSIFRDFGAVI